MKLKKVKRERDPSPEPQAKKRSMRQAAVIGEQLRKKLLESPTMEKQPKTALTDDAAIDQKDSIPTVVEEPVSKKFYFGPIEPTLQLLCWEEELSEIQLEAYKKADEEHNSVQSKLDAMVKDTGGEVVYTGDKCMAYKLTGKAPGLTELAEKSAELMRSRSISKEPEVVPRGRKAKREKSYRDDDYCPSPPPPLEPEPRTRDKKKGKKEVEDKKHKDKHSTTPTNVQSVTSGMRPSEASAIGGLATGAGNKNTPVVDLTKEDNRHVADSKEVSFNKLQGKTFPSLVVVARPYLRAKDGALPSDRSILDSKVKSVLMHTPTKFTEWLIQQGLVRSDQLCAIHHGNKLKLGMYSDVSKFPYSGGYVWISECCPTRFVSVFSGSLFEGSTHPPSVLLKLIYHWACQTNVQNVVQWVKVDNLYVKGLFTWLRGACTAALHQHMRLLGGPGHKIEVGVISLGTTSHDGTQRQVKVEVLGVLDPQAKLIRLRAVEPLADGERNYKKRFQKILEPLTLWVNPSSTILTDLTVDKGTLVSMGFRTVHQSSSNDSTSKNSNANIMEYLRRIVPRMFQNTLSLLSRQIIQQFLDELVWREWFGTTPGQAFDNIVIHLAEQTRLDGKDALVVRMNKIAANPFKNWSYMSRSKSTAESAVIGVKEKVERRGRKRKSSPARPPTPPTPPPTSSRRNTSGAGKETRRKKPVNYVEDDEDYVVSQSLDSKKKKKDKKEPKKKKDKIIVLDDLLDDVPLKSIKKEMRQNPNVNLEAYYFGQLDGESSIVKRNILVQCPTCAMDFTNNCAFLRHLLEHSAGGSVGVQCVYCVKQFAGAEELDTHLHQLHPLDTKNTSIYTYACIICEVRFGSVQTLANHMYKSHAALELPYMCGECGYRSSSHRATVDHFYLRHSGGANVQCPFCLKTVAIYADGCDLQGNIQFFQKHLLAHAEKEKSPKCNRCILRFVHLGMMKEHQVRCHNTVFGALPLCTEGHKIPKPKNKATPPVKDSLNHLMLDSYDELTLVLPEGMLCKECDTHLDDDKHFLGTCKCTKCPFISSCWRALLQHSSTCGGSQPARSLPLPAPGSAHCICSFSSNDAGDMLSHLLVCDRQTAYVSEEDAKYNTVAVVKPTPEVVKDTVSEEVQEESETAGETHKDVEIPSEESLSESVPVPVSASEPPVPDYPAPNSVINTQLSLDDLAPPSVLQPDHQMELEQLKNDEYEQPLATPQVQHEELDRAANADSMSHVAGGLDSYMDTGEFEPLPAEPMPQPEFEPL